MIGRLGELLLRVNPMVRDALRLTYSHLFMDEFQDTTQIKYDLVRTILFGTDTTITVVGDNNQQIMRWGMAMDDPFAAFDADFAGKRTPIYNNYRSSPELVRIQHVLAQALDARAVPPISKTTGTIAGDSCAIWDFSAPEIEAARLAAFVAAEMKTHNLGPREFVLLVRQKAPDYAAVLEMAFNAAGIPLRNEAGTVWAVMLQELLAEKRLNWLSLLCASPWLSALVGIGRSAKRRLRLCTPSRLMTRLRSPDPPVSLKPTRSSFAKDILLRQSRRRE